MAAITIGNTICSIPKLSFPATTDATANVTTDTSAPT